MPSQQLGKPLSGVFPIEGGHARLFEHGVSVTANPAANGNGWHGGPFEVSFSHAVLTCEGPKPYNGPDGTDLSISGQCTDPTGVLWHITDRRSG